MKQPARGLANLTAFLADQGADVSSVIAGVDSAIGLGDDDLLLAVGSVVEGLGSRKSDLDLLLVVPDTASHAAGDEMTLLVGRCLVEVRFQRVGQVRALLDRFDAWRRGPWNITHQAGFSLPERALLHRLHHGVMVHGTDPGLIEQRRSLPDLARLKLQDARQTSRTIQVDLVGYRENEDYRSLVFASQDLLGLAVDALLATYGYTNPAPKWRSRLLDQVPAGWEESFVLRPTGLSPGDRVWRLHRAPPAAHRAPAVRHALAITAFTRAVFAGAERALLSTSNDPAPAGPAAPAVRLAPATAGRSPGSGPAEAPLPFLDFDVDFMPEPDGPGRVMIARLNEFGRPLVLCPREFASVLLFDGETTASQAQAALYGDRSGDRNDEVSRVVARVAEAGLCGPALT